MVLSQDHFEAILERVFFILDLGSNDPRCRPGIQSGNAGKQNGGEQSERMAGATLLHLRTSPRNKFCLMEQRATPACRRARRPSLHQSKLCATLDWQASAKKAAKGLSGGRSARLSVGWVDSLGLLPGVEN